MNLRIKYNNEDISNMIDLQSCILTDRYGGLLDSIKLVINDIDKKWCGYGVKKGDEIVITTDTYTTGMMYVTQFEHQKGVVVIDAVSLKPSKKEVKSKIWLDVRLFEILNDCAKNNGLELKTYGVTDYYYKSLAQIHKTDLEFVSAICKREGYSIKVDDNCLIVFNEYYLESQSTNLKITPNDIEDNYSFVRVSNCTNNVTVSHYDFENGLIEHTAIDDEIVGDAKIVNEMVSSHDEARRHSYGYLRDYNKKHITGYITMPYNSKISAGTLFYAEGFKEFDGKYVVAEVSHNTKKELSNLIVRRTLNY